MIHEDNQDRHENHNESFRAIDACVNELRRIARALGVIGMDDLDSKLHAIANDLVDADKEIREYEFEELNRSVKTAEGFTGSLLTLALHNASKALNQAAETKQPTTSGE